MRFPAVTATKVRLSIEAKAAPIISKVGIFNAPLLLVAPTMQRNKEGEVTLTPPEADAQVYYTLDGTSPTEKSMRYTAPLAIKEPTVLKTVTFDSTTRQYSAEAVYTLDVPKTQWQVVAIGAGDKAAAQKVVDELPNSWFWQEKGKTNTFITIDLGQEYLLKGFTYLPSQDRWAEGTISHYVFEVSTDGKHWKKTSEGEFGNIKNNPIEQRISFSTPEKARYMRLTAIKTVDDTGKVSYAEIGIITQ